jgi:hypothetical protein
VGVGGGFFHARLPRWNLHNQGAVAVHPQLSNDDGFPMDVALGIMDVDDSHNPVSSII